MGEVLDTRDHIVRSVATLAIAFVTGLIVLWFVAGLLGFGTAIGLIFAGVCFVVVPYLLPRDWPPVTGATFDRGLAYVKGSAKAPVPAAPVPTAPVAAPAPVAMAPAPAATPGPVASAPVVPTPIVPAAPESVVAPAPVAAPAPEKLAPVAKTAPEAQVMAEPVPAPASSVAEHAEFGIAAPDGSAANAISARVREAARAAGEAARLLAGDTGAPATNAKPTGLAGPRSEGADDLKRIKGVGPKLESLLRELGVYHFDQIAAWGPAEAAWIDAHIDGFSGRATRDDWIGQAKILAAGGETEHSKRVDKGLST